MTAGLRSLNFCLEFERGFAMAVISAERWALLVCGVVMFLLTTTMVLLRREHPVKRTNVFLFLVFAGLLTGLGVFGMDFMPKYGEWIQVLNDMVEEGTLESYNTFLAQVGAGKMPGGLRDAGLAYAVSHPVEGMDVALEDAAEKAAANSEGKKMLVRAQQDMERKRTEIDRFLEDKIDVAGAEKFSRSTVELMHMRMKELPPSERRRLGITPQRLKEYGDLAAKLRKVPE